MSQGFTTEISKEQKDIIQGTDTWEFIKIGNLNIPNFSIEQTIKKYNNLPISYGSNFYILDEWQKRLNEKDKNQLVSFKKFFQKSIFSSVKFN